MGLKRYSLERARKNSNIGNPDKENSTAVMGNVGHTRDSANKEIGDGHAGSDNRKRGSDNRKKGAGSRKRGTDSCRQGHRQPVLTITANRRSNFVRAPIHVQPRSSRAIPRRSAPRRPARVPRLVDEGRRRWLRHVPQVPLVQARTSAGKWRARAMVNRSLYKALTSTFRIYADAELGVFA